MNEYAEKLTGIKAHYPFKRWHESELEQYTDEACRSFAAIFDHLIDGLIAIGPDAEESSKIALFKKAIETTNSLNEEDDSLIETGEREDLCELTNLIAVEAGLDPSNYGDGEGPASEWRDW